MTWKRRGGGRNAEKAWRDVRGVEGRDHRPVGDVRARLAEGMSMSRRSTSSRGPQALEREREGARQREGAREREIKREEREKRERREREKKEREREERG